MATGSETLSDPPPLGPTVRAAGPDDLDELVRLDTAAREHLHQHRGGPVYLLRSARPRPPHDSLEADLADELARISLGCIGDVPVGYAVTRLVELGDGSTVAEVSDIFVEPAARDVGVGGALMDDAVEWARERGCVGIDAHALPGDRHTKNFFESFGLVARAITVHRDLRST